MIEKKDIEKVLAQNLEVDREDLRDALEALHSLRQSGVHRQQYDLTLPFDRQSQGIRMRNAVAKITRGGLEHD